MNHTNYLRVAIGAVAVVVVLGLFGVPVGSYAPFALILLVCPLMMFFMMRGMGPRRRFGPRRPPEPTRRAASGRRAGRPVTASRR